MKDNLYYILKLIHTDITLVCTYYCSSMCLKSNIFGWSSVHKMFVSVGKGTVWQMTNVVCWNWNSLGFVPVFTLLFTFNRRLWLIATICMRVCYLGLSRCLLSLVVAKLKAFERLRKAKEIFDWFIENSVMVKEIV